MNYLQVKIRILKESKSLLDMKLNNHNMMMDMNIVLKIKMNNKNNSKLYCNLILWDKNSRTLIEEFKGKFINSLINIYHHKFKQSNNISL